MTGSTTYSAKADPIGFIDSGIGGLPYLERARNLLPGEHFVYLADRKNFPYGVRPRDEVRDIVMDAVAALVHAAHPKLIVIACNTASVVSLAELRSTFSIPFVGVVPAIKPAGKAASGGRIGLLATERTVEDSYLSDLVRDFASDSELVSVAAGDLVEVIENRLAVAPESEIMAAIESAAGGLRTEAVDAVVLGCTHFVHIRQQLSSLLGPGIPVFDSVDGVARQIVRLCGGSPVSAADRPDAADALLVTGEDPGENYRLLAAAYKLQLVLHGGSHGWNPR